jgi:hypothetical protein
MGLAILLSSPALEIGERRMRHAGKLTQRYHWEATTPGHAHGISIDSRTVVAHEIALDQQSDGVQWQIQATTAPDHYTRQDTQHLRRDELDGGIVFYAHPLLHGVSWSVPETIANKHVVKALKKQPFRRYRGEGPTIAGPIEKLRMAGENSAGQAAIMQQTPSQIWGHGQAIKSESGTVRQRDNSTSFTRTEGGTSVAGSCSAAEE